MKNDENAECQVNRNSHQFFDQNSFLFSSINLKLIRTHDKRKKVYVIRYIRRFVFHYICQILRQINQK